MLTTESSSSDNDLALLEAINCNYKELLILNLILSIVYLFKKFSIYNIVINVELSVTSVIEEFAYNKNNTMTT